jgi:hypothetical protein
VKRFNVFLTFRKYGFGFHTTHQSQLRCNLDAFLRGSSALRLLVPMEWR